MKTWKICKISVAAVVAAFLAVAWQANAVIVYQSSTAVGNQGQNGPWALGLDFTVNTDGYVTQIGAFDSSDNGQDSAQR